MLSNRWQTIAEDSRLSDPRIMTDIMNVHDAIVGDLLAYLGFTFSPHPTDPNFVAVARNGRTCMVPQHHAALPCPPILTGPGINKTPEQIAEELSVYLQQAVR